MKRGIENLVHPEEKPRQRVPGKRTPEVARDEVSGPIGPQEVPEPCAEPWDRVDTGRRGWVKQSAGTMQEVRRESHKFDDRVHIEKLSTLVDLRWRILAKSYLRQDEGKCLRPPQVPAKPAHPFSRWALVT